MPDLDVLIIQDLEERTKRFLDTTGGYEDFEFLSAGGSAAVFKVKRKGRLTAFKAFSPEFFLVRTAMPKGTVWRCKGV